MSATVPKKFYFDVVLAVGAAMALFNFGVFFFFYITNLVFTLDLSGFFLQTSRVVVTTLLYFAAIIWLKRKGAIISFFSIMAHFVLIGVVAACVQTVPESFFYQNNPTYKAEIIKVHRDRFKAIADSIEDKKVRENAMKEIQNSDVQYEFYQKNPTTNQMVFQENLIVYLFSSLLLGFILGGLFHYISQA